MSQPPRLPARAVFWGIVLSLALAIWQFAPDTESAQALPVVRAGLDSPVRSTRQPVAPAGIGGPTRGGQNPLGAADGDRARDWNQPFQLQSWSRPAPAPPPPKPEATATVAPPASQSPPPPALRIAGRLEDGDSIALFVQFGDANLVVRKGDVIGGQYRVDEIDARALRVTHLATGSPQVVALGESR